ncbi:aminoglycoside phosphotransferase family protein [Nocardiopsis trehalosi]|uniref:aminoglycoside phosphotransferase family protein n=1 Tax=Nocardiopsis trehalosi TaxID=109329 RepID=UPI00082DAA22|nr:aminoglycoside phosphotransferase family protein [Nocardiopsis trehalosi]
MSTDYPNVLATAVRAARIAADPERAEPVRIGENAVFRLPDGLIVRIARTGQENAARREVRIARWLADHGVPAVRPRAAEQPVLVDGHAVTFWDDIGDHTTGTAADVAHLIRALHDLPLPPERSWLGRLDPFVRLDQRIDDAATLPQRDRDWLRDHLAGLRQAWLDLPPGLGERLVHGDAWVGNVARPHGGPPLLLDLERCSLGRPEWDLVSTAIKLTSFAWLPGSDYAEFVTVYGHDVTDWSGFAVMRDVRELRMALYFAQHAATSPRMHDEAVLRLRCLQGHEGPRPWPWTPAA